MQNPDGLMEPGTAGAQALRLGYFMFMFMFISN